MLTWASASPQRTRSGVGVPHRKLCAIRLRTKYTCVENTVSSPLTAASNFCSPFSGD